MKYELKPQVSRGELYELVIYCRRNPETIYAWSLRYYLFDKAYYKASATFSVNSHMEA